MNSNKDNEHGYTKEVFLELTMNGIYNSLDYSKRKALEVFEKTGDEKLLRQSLQLIKALEDAVENV